MDLRDVKADYEASKRTSRFQRRRRGIPSMGAGGDYHYRAESDFLWMSEVARDMYRNDPVIGQLTDRAVINWIGSGLTPDPDTGDKALDKELKERWCEESEEPDDCDLAGELTFHEQELMFGREMLVAGDVFGVFVEGGTVQMLESHRCRSPYRTQRNIVHGIELDRITRRRKMAYFTKEPVDAFAEQSRITIKDLEFVPFRREDGEANVMQVYSPKRCSQTRGITAYAPIITQAGMFDDLNFAHLLKAQLNAFWLMVRKRDQTFFDANPNLQRLGVPDSYLSGSRRVEQVAPGSEIEANPGESIEPWNPNTPPAEFFNHARLILTLIGINLGMPLVITLMDASETNFSGFRGAVDQARMGFRHNQRIMRSRFHRPYYRNKLNFWADYDLALARQRERLGKAYLNHKWAVPGWPYIEPLGDAKADLIRTAHMQSSPRRIAVERGFDWDEIVAETVEDRAAAIRLGCAEAQKLNKDFNLSGNDMVSWRDIAPLPAPTGVTVSLADNPQATSNSTSGAKANAKPTA